MIPIGWLRGREHLDKLQTRFLELRVQKMGEKEIGESYDNSPMTDFKWNDDKTVALIATTDRYGEPIVNVFAHNSNNLKCVCSHEVLLRSSCKGKRINLQEQGG